MLGHQKSEQQQPRAVLKRAIEAATPVSPVTHRLSSPTATVPALASCHSSATGPTRHPRTAGQGARCRRRPPNDDGVRRGPARDPRPRTARVRLQLGRPPAKRGRQRHGGRAGAPRRWGLSVRVGPVKNQPHGLASAAGYKPIEGLAAEALSRWLTASGIVTGHSDGGSWALASGPPCRAQPSMTSSSSAHGRRGSVGPSWRTRSAQALSRKP